MYKYAIILLTVQKVNGFMHFAVT